MTVLQEVHGRTLVVRIEREHKRNAIDTETTIGISEALDRLDDDPELWVGVITGRNRELLPSHHDYLRG